MILPFSFVWYVDEEKYMTQSKAEEAETSFFFTHASFTTLQNIVHWEFKMEKDRQDGSFQTTVQVRVTTKREDKNKGI